MKASLCVVAYNEEKFLPNLFRDLTMQTYPHDLIEVILVNSASTDNTRYLMEQFSKENNGFVRVLVVDNPKRIQASGWNIAIAASSGDVIFRIDAHTHIPREFTSLNMRNILDGEFVSGGVRSCLMENDSAWGRTLLQVENSLFGSSVNKCRRSNKRAYVKTVFHGAYRREVFAKAGGFNENLLRTEDNDMNYRILKAGYKICLDPNILSYQYARSGLRKMINQKFGNGLWIALTLGVTPGCISLFHLIPLCFVLGIVLTTVLAIVGLWQFAALMWTMYALFAIINTVISIASDGFLMLKLVMPILFLILHISYGVGSLCGIVKMPFVRSRLSKCEEMGNIKKTMQDRIFQTTSPL